MREAEPMNIPKLKKRATFFGIDIVALWLLFFCTGCISSNFPLNSEELKKAYQEAINDAEGGRRSRNFA